VAAIVAGYVEQDLSCVGLDADGRLEPIQVRAWKWR
jgi:hypothetical protein